MRPLTERIGGDEEGGLGMRLCAALADRSDELQHHQRDEYKITRQVNHCGHRSTSDIRLTHFNA